MTVQELKSQIAFNLGLPTNENVELQQIETAIEIAFRELKRYIRTPVDKTVPYNRRLDLVKLGVKTKKVLNVYASRPRLGMSLGSIESGNVFEVAVAVNASAGLGKGRLVNTDPIKTEMALSQLRNTLSTDFQWSYDPANQVVYCAHRSPMPTHVTLQYVPDFSDISEITSYTWLDYLARLAEAHMKKSLGRSRSKYRVEGSNVTLDGEMLLTEANAELEAIRQELEGRRSKLVILN